MAAPIRLADEDMEWLRDEQYRRAGASPSRKGPPFHEIVSEALTFFRSQGAPQPIATPPSSANNEAHALIDELIDQRPETAKNMLATIRALLNEEMTVARVVPAAEKQEQGTNRKRRAAS